MKLLGLGTQIVECVKVARMLDEYQDRFLSHVFTSNEIKRCRERTYPVEAFAAVWACKEAVYRALGTRWRKGMNWTDVEIRHGPTGDTAELHGHARRLATERAVTSLFISSSHTRKYATATVVACG